MKDMKVFLIVGFVLCCANPVNAESVSENDIKQWWRWYLGIPAANHPFLDDSWMVDPQATCEQGQSGGTWYLAGTDSFAAGTTRECNVPRNKAVLFSVINVECSTIETESFFGNFDPSPNKQYPEPTLTQCVEAIGFSSADDLVIMLNGVPVVPTDIGVSNHFQFNVPDDNIAGIVGANRGKSRAGGYYGKVGPFAPGSYTLEIMGVLNGGPFAGFAQNVTYELTVE